ncbi:hypothetical protein [Salinicoccus luteus]|uniref:hypothetical protein n=1 Tax=Salinicoccus luteus TaxID=367840 RepID=UPI0004E16594|nr:hypothetical protein [Salinicoccus luteus]
MYDILIVLLMLVALLLFVWSRLQLNRTKKSMTSHNYAEEIYHQVSKDRRAGKTRGEVIEVLKKNYGLDQHEAEYIYRRTADERKGNG